ncbi:DUF6401 family natural product biosynthesis protein [Dactylosporangium sp. NPDC050588]|uniref:DUF6401 family natural product biosynthesis protein n=1 Tax=Dactylosporangium sp. NPDC050588 TaxID=3157211 RepID=UPI0033FD75C1
MNVPAPHLATVRTLLDRLDRRIGAAGLAAAAAIPGLLAQVDQHAAEVRELLGGNNRRPTLPALASYADGLLDGAADRGWCLPQHDLVGWVNADRVAIRLVAVCALARRTVT